MLSDDRGQSIQIGAILLFGILIIGLAIVQTVVVPTENEQVEFNGYLETTEDLVTLRNDILTAGTQGGEQAEVVKTGVRYPSRAVLINPGPPVGSLQTTTPQNVTISGVTAVSGEEENVQGFWNTSVRGPQNYTTQSVRFSPAYNSIDVPPIDVDPNGAYRLTDNGPVSLTGRTLITGNRITLVTVEGDLGTSSLTTSVAATPVSVATRSVTVTGSGSEFNVSVTVSGNGTEAAATAWNNSAAAQSIRSNTNVERTYVNGSRVDVVFNGSRTYQLKLARVVVHEKGDSGVDTDTDPQYLVPLTSNGTAVPTDGTTDVTVEVRDRYNNPVGGVDVEFTASDGSLDGGPLVTTDADGTATVPFNISDGTDTAEVTAEIDGQGVDPYNSTTIELARAGAGTGAGGTGPDINPGNRSSDLVLLDASLKGCSGGSGNNCDRVDATFKNFDSSSVKNITNLKFSFYAANGPGNSVQEPPASVDVNGDEAVTLDIGGDFEMYGERFNKNEQDVIEFEFRNGGGGSYTVRNGNFFIISALVDTDGDGTADRAYNYFIAPL
jgi:hypothetical protein